MSLDPIGDFAFNVLDYLLHHADYQRGLVKLTHRRNVVYCYSQRELERELTRITREVVEKKHGAVPDDLDDIVTNAMDEYGRELHSTYRQARAS